MMAWYKEPIGWNQGTLVIVLAGLLLGVLLGLALSQSWIPLGSLFWLQQAENFFQHCEVCRENTDIVSVAVQMGRFDLVSMLMTVFGILLAFASFIGYWVIQDRVTKVCEINSQIIAKSYLKDELPQLVVNELSKYTNPKIYKDSALQTMQLTLQLEKTAPSESDADEIVNRGLEE